MPGSMTCPACAASATKGLLAFDRLPVFCNVLHDTAEAARSAPVGTVELLQCERCGMIVNAAFQDVDPSGTDSAVRYGGNAGGNIIINTPQTYTSRTILGGGESTLQFKHDYNVGDPSGPFGLGTLVALNAANNQLAPIEGDRTIANPIQMEVGFTVTNIPGDSSSVTFTGPEASE